MHESHQVECMQGMTIQDVSCLGEYLIANEQCVGTAVQYTSLGAHKLGMAPHNLARTQLAKSRARLPTASVQRSSRVLLQGDKPADDTSEPAAKRARISTGSVAESFSANGSSGDGPQPSSSAAPSESLMTTVSTFALACSCAKGHFLQTKITSLQMQIKQSDGLSPIISHAAQQQALHRNCCNPLLQHVGHHASMHVSELLAGSLSQQSLSRRNLDSSAQLVVCHAQHTRQRQAFCCPSPVD